MVLSPDEMSLLAQVAYDAFMSGLSAEDVRESLDLDDQNFHEVLTKMFDTQAAEVRDRPTEHVYVQYIIDQARNIGDLSRLIRQFRSTSSHSAMVSAVRARSDIQDKILERGQQFGIIASEPEKSGSLVAGIVIAELTNLQLRQTVVRELSNVRAMIRDTGDKDFGSIEVGQIHRGPSAELPPSAAESESGNVTPITKKTKKKKQRIRIIGAGDGD